jgi:myo-inositol-1(or 4)-monophosphatase
MGLSRDLDRTIFEELSRSARSVLGGCGRDLGIRNKADAGFDPVTDLDCRIEERLREIILRKFPGDAVVGEEFGGEARDGARCWSIDPVDGTRAFICGLPSWAVLVGVVEDGLHTASMIDLPATSELFIAHAGRATLNGEPLRTSGEVELARARLSTTDPFLFEGLEFAAFNRVRQAVLVTRYGLDGSAYARLASGTLDLVIESGLKRHDYDALIPMVRFAGGHVGDWTGGEDFASGRIVAAATRELHDAAVGIMSVRI